MILKELLTAFTLGLIGGVIPGPVITAIFTEILQSGFKRSLRIIIIAMAIETMVAVVSLLIFSFLGIGEAVFRGLSFGGALLLAWIAFSLWKVKSLDIENRISFGPWKITAMILTNGVLWIYWITICIPQAMLLKEKINHGEYLFMAMVQVGWLISTVILAYIFSRFRGFLSKPRIIPFAFKFFAIVFIYFGLDMTIRSIQFFL